MHVIVIRFLSVVFNILTYVAGYILTNRLMKKRKSDDVMEFLLPKAS